jgi:pyridoxine 5-phosphate synthase
MPRLCVGLNKVALLRSSRGSRGPDPCAVASELSAAGCRAVLVHAWPDQRHITLADVLELAGMREVRSRELELRVGGDLRDDVLGLVRTAGRVSAFVVTPFDARERTTQRGWGRGDDQAHLRAAVRRLRPGTAVSVFCDPDPEGIELAAAAGATSVELNCRGFVESFGGQGQAVEIARLRAAAERARALGLAVNAAHDLGVRQLRTLTDEVPLDLVSVGHRFFADALVAGAVAVLPDYLQASESSTACSSTAPVT